MGRRPTCVWRSGVLFLSGGNVKSRTPSMSFAIVLCAIATLVGTNAYAQGGLTGQISGTVVDNTKAVLPGVTVSVKNSNTGVVRDVVTDATGAFVATNLLAGT